MRSLRPGRAFASGSGIAGLPDAGERLVDRGDSDRAAVSRSLPRTPTTRRPGLEVIH